MSKTLIAFGGRESKRWPVFRPDVSVSESSTEREWCAVERTWDLGNGRIYGQLVRSPCLLHARILKD